MKYASVVLGGTFDRLHKGHQALLAKAFSVGNSVTIGLTTDEYVKNAKCPTYASSFAKASEDKKASEGRQMVTIFPYTVRKQQLEEWLGKQGWNGRYTIVPLSDSYGPTLLRPRPQKGVLSDFHAIVVSSETRKTAEEINALRSEHGLCPLAIICIPMIPAEDLQKISSTRVRAQEIDVKGRLILPDALRGELRKAIGEYSPDSKIQDVLKGDAKRILITVGDMTTKKIFDFGVRPNLAIIDFQMERKPFLWEKEALDSLTKNSTVVSLQSGPGYISQEALRAIHTTFKSQTLKGTVIFVDGEEDLLVLPVIREAPLGSVVYYGQPNKGIIRVHVTEKKKYIAESLLHKFIRSI